MFGYENQEPQMNADERRFVFRTIFISVFIDTNQKINHFRMLA